MSAKTKEKIAYFITIALGFFFFGWWIINQIFGQKGDASLENYSDTYFVTALSGAVYGFFAAKQWGGRKSLFGKATLAFSLGLLGQVFGQLVYSYYALVKHVEVPYPSLGDIGFFGSVLLYIIGILLLMKALGSKFGLATMPQKIIAIIAPLALLIGSCVVLLQGYQSSGDTLVTLLDFAYPIGQAFYISLALLTYILSFKLLGGIMKNKILLLLAALVMQYAADFLFIYSSARDEWYAGGIDDLLYQISYLMMAIALIQIGKAARLLSAPSPKENATPAPEVRV